MTDIEKELDKINVKLEEMGFDIGRCVPFHKFDENSILVSYTSKGLFKKY